MEVSVSELGTHARSEQVRSTHLLAVDLDICHVVLEDRRHVHVRELVFAEHDQQASFTARTVSNDHKLKRWQISGTDEWPASLPFF